MAIAEECGAWASGVFHVTIEDAIAYWVEQKSLETYFYVLRDDHGAVAGIALFKFFAVEYQGRPVIVSKIGLGVSPKHRGNKFAMRCLLRTLAIWKARHPRAPLYVFSTLIHPVTYKLSCDLLGEQMYPHYSAPVDPDLANMAATLAEQFGIRKADSELPFAYKEVFSTKETEESVSYWHQSNHPAVRFFVEHCPDYHTSDNCLIVLAPVRFSTVIMRGARIVLRNRVAKYTGRKYSFDSRSPEYKRSQD